jgi:hypothetical protein
MPGFKRPALGLFPKKKPRSSQSHELNSNAERLAWFQKRSPGCVGTNRGFRRSGSKARNP